MSERLQEANEHQKPLGHEAETMAKRPEISVEYETHKQQEALTQAERSVEHHAKSKHATQVEKDTGKHEQPLFVNAELKRIALDRTLARVRRHLSKPNKTFSRIIHQPAVQAVSEVGAKTVARPSGLLAGSFCALLGSSFVLYQAKHYGFKYNYSIFFVFFVGGFAVGLGIDMFLWIFRRRRPDI